MFTIQTTVSAISSGKPSRPTGTPEPPQQLAFSPPQVGRYDYQPIALTLRNLLLLLGIIRADHHRRARDDSGRNAIDRHTTLCQIARQPMDEAVQGALTRSLLNENNRVQKSATPIHSFKDGRNNPKPCLFVLDSGHSNDFIVALYSHSAGQYYLQ